MTNQQKKYGIFSVVICPNCFSYQIDHDPNLVFHGVPLLYLKTSRNCILTPGGAPTAPFYDAYLPQRFIHLGHLSLCGLMSDYPDKIWLGFDIAKIRKKYPHARYMDYDIWENLGFHRNALPPKVESDMRNKLFADDYSTDPKTEILVDKLDCRLAQVAIVKSADAGKSVKRKVNRRLETIIFSEGPQISAKRIAHLEIHCECNLGN